MLEHLKNIVSAVGVKADVLDWVPFVSTVTNGINLLEKIVIDSITNPNTIKNHYFKHVNEKRYLACMALLIPGVNVLYKLFQTYQKGVDSGGYSPNISEPIINLGTLSVVETGGFKYGLGKHTAHMLNDNELDSFQGGIYINTINTYKNNFASIIEDIKSLPTKDDQLLSDWKECNEMIQQYLQACIDSTPTVVSNVVYNVASKLPVVGKVAQTYSNVVEPAYKIEAERFRLAVSKLKAGEYRFDTVNLRMGSGYHTVSRVVICHEPRTDTSPGKYDILVGNVGGACRYHPWKDDKIVLPFGLENMTLDQVVDKRIHR